jgi:hypothetical protein
VGAERREVGGDSGLVVGGAATVEPAVPLSGLERLGIPLRGIAFRLHVMVGVEQHGGRPRGCGMAGDHRRGTALGDDLDVGEPGFAQ